MLVGHHGHKKVCRMSTEIEQVEAVESPVEAPVGSMKLTVKIEDSGACKRHICVTVSADDVRAIRDDAVSELNSKAQVPGFRMGKVPAGLLRKKFRKELEADVKQKVLVRSLDQITRENGIEPLGEPRLNFDSIEVPEEGDFSYEFDVEVRPSFDLPDFSTFTITRPSGEPTAEDIEAFTSNFLSSQANRITIEEPAAPGDFIICQMTFTSNGKVIRELSSESVRLMPILNFPDAVLEGFSDLMQGVTVGDSREATVTISTDSPVIEMRGEVVSVRFDVAEVQRCELPELNSEFLSTFDYKSEEDFRTGVVDVVRRQLTYAQRQSTRDQLLEKMTATASWDLPESLVRQQTENATRREILEMSQAGFTPDQIIARQTQIQQNAVENTRAALKQHFILDRIATEHKIEASREEVELELMLMARQQGEPVRRVRARLAKNGMIENLEAQLRERKAIDFLLSQVQFTDVPHEPIGREDQSSVRFAICGNMKSSLMADTDRDEESGEDSP
jgi:trigger factor